jgi:hypothetical protein
MIMPSDELDALFPGRASATRVAQLPWSSPLRKRPSASESAEPSCMRSSAPAQSSRFGSAAFDECHLMRW